MKVLFTCADKPTISRNLFHRNYLKKHYDTIECVSEGKSYASRIPSVLFCLLKKMWSADIFFVGYMGHFLVVFLRLFTKKPIIFDFYLSIYDVMCNDRKIYTPNSLAGRFTYWIEKRSLELADFVIVDTDKLIETLSKEYGVNKEKFVRVPLTINEKNVKPVDVKKYSENFSVLYVGSYIPLHGTPLIIEAARLAQENGEKISFLMIGKGPDFETCYNLAQKYNLTNIEFKGFMPLEELNYYYNACDVNLGLFNTGERANSVILNKTNDAFRVGKPHVTLNTDAMSEAFKDEEDIFFVPENTPKSLFETLLKIKNNPTLLEKVGQNALKTYEKKLSNASAEKIVTEKIFQKIIKE
ncbi:MAG: glycosyltransferase family 4 protein [Epsilonproteobacteria bacterium]|nr:glycosyltransferase family 4 protein [Campylobacterota bacterium]